METVIIKIVSFFGKFAAKKGLNNLSKKLSEEHYSTELQKVILDTINDYHNAYPNTNHANKIHFYESQIFFDYYLEFRFADKDINILELKPQLDIDSRIINVSTEELTFFTESFRTNIDKAPQVRRLFVEENYKEKIFEVANTLNQVKASIDQIDHSSEITLLSEVEKNIIEFKPDTALTLLKIVEKNIHNSKYQASILFAHGMIKGEIGDIEESNSFLLKAFSLCSNELKYAKKAALIFAKKKNYDSATSITEKFLKNYPTDPKLWAIKKFLEGKKISIDCFDIDSIVKDLDINNEFESTLNHLVNTYNELEIIFGRYYDQEILPQNISFQNKSFWLFFTHFVFIKITSQIPFDLAEPFNNIYYKNVKCKYAITLFEKVLSPFEKTEKFKYLLHYQFYHAYLKYLSEPNKKTCKVISEIFELIEYSKKEQYVFALAIAYSQTEMFEELIQLNDFGNNAIRYIKALANKLLNNSDTAYQLGRKYIENTTIIDENNIGHFCLVVNALCKNFEQKEALLNACDDKGVFKNELLEEVATLHVKWNTLAPEIIIQMLNSLLTKINSINNTLFFRSIVELLSRAEMYLKACDVIEKIVDFEIPSFDHQLYIINLHNSNTRQSELLGRLSNWRKKFDFRVLQFYFWEINLLKLIPHWREIEIVAEDAIKYFPEQPAFIIFHTESLFKQNRLNILSDEYKNKILSFSFDEEEAYYLFRIYLILNHVEFAFEFFFGYACVKDNIRSRERYFFNFKSFEKLQPYNSDKVKVGCYVQLQINNSSRLLYIRDQIQIQNNRIMQLVFGMSEGETMSYENKISKAKKTTIRIDKIYNKYDGLYIEISKEIDNPTNISDNFIRLSHDTFEGFEEQLIKLFAKQDLENSHSRKALLNNYANGSASFSEIVRIFKNKPLDAYRYLSSRNGEGIIIRPSKLFTNLSLEDKFDYAIDFSTLPLFFHLDKEIKITGNFYISQYVSEIIKINLVKIENVKDGTMSLRITETGISPSFYPIELIKEDIEYYKKLLDWIQDKCKTVFLKEKLDIIGGDIYQKENFDIYAEYLVDTAFLANRQNIRLISDDKVLFDLLNINNSIISSELFLTNYANKYEEDVLPILLRNNYKGIKISEEILFKEFENYIQGRSNIFDQCLNNMSIKSTLDSNNMILGIKLIKSIYSNKYISTPRRRLLTQRIFKAILNKFPLNNEAIKLNLKLFRVNFYYLPERKQRNIIEDFETVYSSMNVLK